MAEIAATTPLIADTAAFVSFTSSRLSSESARDNGCAAGRQTGNRTLSTQYVFRRSANRPGIAAEVALTDSEGLGRATT